MTIVNTPGSGSNSAGAGKNRRRILLASLVIMALLSLLLILGNLGWFVPKNNNFPTGSNKDVVNVSDVVNINKNHAATDSGDGGIPNAVDNCPNVPNPGQADVDHNGIGNLCDVRPSGNGGSTATSPNSNNSSGGSRIVVRGGGDSGGAISSNTVLGGQGGGSSVPSNSIPPPRANHAPVANDKSVTTNEDTSVLVTLTASDKDGYSLTYTISSIPKNGTLSTLDVDKISYTPNANFNGNDTFTFRAFDGQTYSNNATISIKVNPVNDNRISRVELTIDGNATAYQTATPKAAGDWSTWSINYNLPGGSHWLTARATDSLNKQAWYSITVVGASNSAPPTVTITSPANNANLPSGLVQFTGNTTTGGSPISKVELSIDGNVSSYRQATPKAAGDWSTWSINYNLPGGSHWLTARATDSLNKQAWYSITVVGASNSAPPTVTITSPANNANLPSGLVQFTGNTTTGGSPISKVELSIDGNVSSYRQATPKAAGDWSTWSIGYNIPVGSHYLVARVTDNMGKQAWNSITVVASASTTAPPAVQITSPANNAQVTAGTVTFAGTASSGAGVAKVELTIDGNATAYQTATPKAAGDWSTWSIGYNIPVGSHTITARITDNAAKQQSNSITVAASSAPLVVQITSPANNAQVTAGTVTFNGTASSGAE